MVYEFFSFIVAPTIVGMIMAIGLTIQKITVKFQEKNRNH
ncbi:hypothetical protein C240_1787 [Enterococcus sp. 5H]|nr:hypothetical protein [Enterococcus sp. 5H]